MSTANTAPVEKSPASSQGDAPEQNKTGAAAADKSADASASQSSAAAEEQTKTFTQADIDAAIERGKRDAAKQAKQKQADEQLSEADRYKQRAEAAESQLREHNARVAFETAIGADARSPAKLVRLYKDDFEFDDTGKLANTKDLVARARREFPEEFAAERPGKVDAGAGRGQSAQSQNSMNDFIRRSTGRQ